MSQERRNHAKEGFTLIEIMAVVLIIGMLSGMVGYAVFRQVDKAKVSMARVQVERLEGALELYHMDNGNFPSTEQGLEALVREPSGSPEPRNYQPGGYLKKAELPLDPWNNEFQYESPGTRNPDGFDLWSFGKDGAAGGDGLNADVGNWGEVPAD